MEREERLEAPLPPPGVLPQNWGGNKPNHTVTCMVLKATANGMRHLALCHVEFRGPRYGLCRSGSISNNNKKLERSLKIVNTLLATVNATPRKTRDSTTKFML
ncbi:uncharacterized protein TNCV_1302691 [Trichonephila clavipes]|nr:uncharacterized protein TNCV_1302691 [Trichonephila clavipes]